MGEFKAGAFKMACKAGAPVVPVAIDGSYRVMEANGGLMKPAHVNITILPRWRRPGWTARRRKSWRSAWPEPSPPRKRTAPAKRDKHGKLSLHTQHHPRRRAPARAARPAQRAQKVGEFLVLSQMAHPGCAGCGAAGGVFAAGHRRPRRAGLRHRRHHGGRGRALGRVCASGAGRWRRLRTTATATGRRWWRCWSTTSPPRTPRR